MTVDLNADGINELLNKAEEAEKKRATKAKKAAKAKKPPETLDEAENRVLGMKLTDDERAVVRGIFNMLRHHEVSRVKEGKISKKEIFEIFQIHKEYVREQKRQHVIDTKPDNFWVVQDMRTLNLLREYAKDEPIFAADTETMGLDIFNHKVVGWSAYFPVHDVAFYIPFGHTTGQKQVPASEALAFAKELFEDESKQSIWHHYKYDGHVLRNMDIFVKNAYWDTQPCAKLLYEHESHRLKDLYAKYILKHPDQAIMFEDLFDDFIIYDKDVILAGIYAAGDAEKTYKLYKFQKPYIDSVGNLKTVWYEIEQPLLQVDLDMERTGFRIDLNRLKELEVEFEPTIEQAKLDMVEAFGIDESFLKDMSESLGREEHEFNFQSPQHLAYLIYDHLGVDPKFGEKFKKGYRTTASDVVDALCRDHEELKPLKEFRQLNKLMTTYIKKIPLAMEPSTGLLHSRFNNLAGDEGQSGAATGRYSSSEYVSGKNSATGDHAKGTNLQNIPSKGKGVEIRKCFIPDDGWIFIGADLSQIEPRIIAHILATRYGDRAMLEFYLAGKDLYTEMAMSTFGFDREYCVDGAYDPTHTFAPRKLMKQGVLAFLYGQSPAAFARNMKVTEDVATMFFAGMTKAFPGLHPFRTDMIERLMTEGKIAQVETLYGRKRRFPEYRENKLKLDKMEAKFYKDGLEIYREGNIKGKTKEENAEIRERMFRVEQGEEFLTDDDREKIIRIGLYWRNKELKEEFWKIRGQVKAVQRRAVNTLIQGSAADVLKQNMIQIHKWARFHRYKLHASIHDEVLMSIPVVELTPELVEQVRKFMCETVKLAVPLKTDIVISPRWMLENKPEEWDFEKQRPKEAA